MASAQQNKSLLHKVFFFSDPGGILGPALIISLSNSAEAALADITNAAATTAIDAVLRNRAPETTDSGVYNI